MKHTLFIALAALMLPSGLAAQQQEPAAPEQEQVQSWMAELQQVHGKLESIQQKAIQDPQLQAAQEALGERVKAAIEKADPTLAQSMARAEALEKEAVAAQEAGDQAKLQELGAEAQQIQAQFMAAQQKAFAQPELAARMEAFQASLEEKMVAIDPAAEPLIARFQELQQKLAAAMQAGS
jgi:hypothetical protein